MKKFVAGLILLVATYGVSMIASHAFLHQPKSPSMLVK